MNTDKWKSVAIRKEIVELARKNWTRNRASNQ